MPYNFSVRCPVFLISAYLSHWPVRSRQQMYATVAECDTMSTAHRVAARRKDPTHGAAAASDGAAAACSAALAPPAWFAASTLSLNKARPSSRAACAVRSRHSKAAAIAHVQVSAKKTRLRAVAIISG